MTPVTGFVEAYYRSLVSSHYCLTFDELPEKSIFDTFILKDVLVDFNKVLNRAQWNTPAPWSGVEQQQQALMNEIWDWCMDNCGEGGFTPVLTGVNDYLRTRSFDVAYMRGVIIESQEQAVQFKLTFDHPMF